MNNRKWTIEPSFTSSYWHRVRLEIAFAGWDETHCSVFVRPVIGRFDVVLYGPPINQKLTLTLMSQIRYKLTILIYKSFLD